MKKSLSDVPYRKVRTLGSSVSWSQVLIYTLLVIMVVAYRLAHAGVWGDGWMSEWPNFSPMGAVVLGAALFLPRPAAWLVPFCAWLGSDIFLNIHYGSASISPASLIVFASFVPVYLLGRLGQKNKCTKWLPMMGLTALSTIAFHLISNTLTWAWQPWGRVTAYPLNLSGWLNVQIFGDGVHQPAAIFFLLQKWCSDVLFMQFAWLFLRRSSPANAHEADNRKPVIGSVA